MLVEGDGGFVREGNYQLVQIGTHIQRREGRNAHFANRGTVITDNAVEERVRSAHHRTLRADNLSITGGG